MMKALRRSLTTLVLVLSLTMGVMPLPIPAANAATWVQAENSLQGSRGWDVPLTAYALETDLSAYTLQTSVTPGQPVTLRIHNQISAQQRIQAYRLGWYGGEGGRLVHTSEWTPGILQPESKLITTSPEGKLVNTVDASDWKDTMTLSTEGWPAGMYFLVIDSGKGLKTQVPLVVRSTSFAGRTTLVTAPATWQAYNRYGGYSAYYGPTGTSDRSRILSFNRPYDRRYGMEHFHVMERGPIVEAERLGLDLAYTSGLDLDREGPDAYRGAAALITLGHDEYWTNAQLGAVQRLRDAGTNWIAMGGNTLWWRVRLSGDQRTMDIYKGVYDDPHPDPAQKTINFADSTIRSTLGSVYLCAGLAGANSGDLVVTDPSMFLFRNTGATRGQVVPGLIKIEADRAVLRSYNPQNLSVAAHSPIRCPTSGTQSFSDITYYSVASGAGVVNMASMGFAIATNDQLQDRPEYRMPAASLAFARAMFANALVEASRGPLGKRFPPSGNASSVLNADPPIVFPEQPSIPAPTVPGVGSSVRGDFTADKLADVMAVSADGALRLYATRLGRTMAAPVTTGSNWLVINWFTHVPDLNRDGQTELLVRRNDGTMWLYPGRGKGYFGVPAKVGSGWNGMSTMTVISDMSGDKRPDILARHSDGKLYRYSLTNLTGWISNRVQIGHGWNAMRSVIAVNDFTGDTSPDVLGVREDGSLWVYRSTGGVLTTVRQVGSGWQGMRKVFSPGDANGDGREDLMGVDAHGNLRLYANLGMRWASPLTVGSRWDSVLMLA
ncbi:VCBS repeat-containing protein [Aestuariimicrobium sp. p3-SID1156]|uniref:VCBS repeat-containing protein n=1 Tax=Aestuariimicrobium sp. p3-SID1156 TaxID=2916038 RepID=UPI00223B5992|nr:VCBS repeat-containing protein [Aestuariimicrobium sp. p3-SID1156]MCT1458021.1 VCBS repeat-containing protein [Aestuariimicrobium sp. p3-SID1156]